MPETKIRKDVKNEWNVSSQQLNPETLVQRKSRSSHVLQYPHTASAICGTKLELPELKSCKYPRGVCQILSTSPVNSCPRCWCRKSIWEKYPDGWIIGFIKYVVWVSSVYFPYMLLLSVSKILSLSQPFFIFLENPPWYCAYVAGAARLAVCLYRHCGSCHIHREWYRLNMSLRMPSGLVLTNGLSRVCLVLKIVLLSYRLSELELVTSQKCPHIGGGHRAKRIFLFFQTTTLGDTNWVNEPFGIIIELKITSQVVNFFEPILLSVYGTSSIV
jgi:hypothetical protein